MGRTLFTVVIPTIGRESLPKTLASINRDYAEIIVVADTFEMGKHDANWIKLQAQEYDADFLAVDAGYHDTGSPQLQAGYAAAGGAWVMNSGDDDLYEPFAFETMARAIESLAEPVPLMFRTALHPTWPDQRRGNREIVVLWKDPVIRDKNITGQCFVIPNDQSRIGSWSIHVDFGFITDTVRLWDGRLEWRTELISQCY